MREGDNLAAIAPSARDVGRTGVGRASLMWIAASAFLVILIGVPIGYIIVNSFVRDGGFSIENLVRHYRNPEILRSIWTTILWATEVSAISVLIGTPLAFGVARTNMWGKKLLRASIVTAIITPPFLRTMSYVVLIGPNAGYINLFIRHLLNLSTTYGPLNIFSIGGLVLLGMPSGVALVFLITSATLEQMDPALEEAARMSGASRFRTAMNITVPMVRNAIFAAAMMAFTTTLGAFGIPYILNIQTLTVSIMGALQMPVDFQKASALSFTVLIISAATLVLYRFLIRKEHQFRTITGRGYRVGVMQLAGSRHWFTVLGLAYSFVTFLLPYAVMLVMPFMKTLGIFSLQSLTLDNYRRLAASAAAHRAIINSVVLAVLTAAICIVVGLVIGYIITRSKIRGRSVLDFIANFPQGIAGTALAAGLILVYAFPPFVYLRLYGTLWIILIAYAIRLFPLSVRYAQTSLLQINNDLEEASRVAGAGWPATTRRIVVPLIRTGLLNAGVLIFLNAFSELSSSILLTSTRTPVIATTILDLLSGDAGLPEACALGTIVFVSVMLIYFLAQKLAGKSLLEETGAATPTARGTKP